MPVKLMVMPGKNNAAKPSRKAQGSLEYLLLVGGSVIIAVIVVFVVLSLVGAGGETTKKLASYTEVVLGEQLAGDEKWTLACGTQANLLDWDEAKPLGVDWQGRTIYPSGEDYVNKFQTRYNIEISATTPPLSGFNVPVKFGDSTTFMTCWLDTGDTLGGGLEYRIVEGSLAGDTVGFDASGNIVPGACDGFRFYTAVDATATELKFNSPDSAEWLIYTPSNTPDSANASPYKTSVASPTATITLSKTEDAASGDALNRFLSNAVADAVINRLRETSGNGWNTNEDFVRFCMIWHGPVPSA